jgi:hypothetical protein
LLPPAPPPKIGAAAVLISKLFSGERNALTSPCVCHVARAAAPHLAPHVHSALSVGPICLPSSRPCHRLILPSPLSLSPATFSCRMSSIGAFLHKQLRITPRITMSARRHIADLMKPRPAAALSNRVPAAALSNRVEPSPAVVTPKTIEQARSVSSAPVPSLPHGARRCCRRRSGLSFPRIMHRQRRRRHRPH